MAADLIRLALLAREACPGDSAGVDAVFWDAVRKLAKTDLLAYGLYVHGHEARVLQQIAFARHMQVITESLDNHNKALIVTPPEHGKSVLMRWHIEQWLGIETEKHFEEPSYPAPTVCLAMNTATQAVRQAKSIASTLEANRRYKELYPNVAPDKGWGWSSDQLYLNRVYTRPDPSLMAVGIMGPIQGSRFGMGVVDDPTDQQDARSPKTLKDQTDWRLGVYADRLVEGALERDIFTRWSRADLYSTLSRDEGRSTLVMPALGFWDGYRGGLLDEATLARLREGRALWPDAWPEARLAGKKREKMLSGDGGLWELTWMCNPERAAGRMIKREWLLYGMPMEGAA